ncbi:VanZ family protein [Spirosoma validum]|uniref:VanZ family protein n=1 Tax=Spirosoma validum TaxID=2771355 RepID=A0A927GCL0_9BACT|nr:VanZ family protein [Spirosoma validum]MBD2752591.1 VanZ family protein [Spirosoma validum]
MNQWFSKAHLRILAAVYTVMILLLVTLPINGEDQVLGKLNDNYVLQVRYDYISHTLLFIPWTVLMWWGYSLRLKTNKEQRIWFAAVLGFAIACEYIQLPLTYRTFNVNDLLANLLGVLLGFLLARGLSKSNVEQQPKRLND